MGDRPRNLTQFSASLNPFPDRARGTDGGGSHPAASSLTAAAAAAAAMAGGNPAALWGEINRMHSYNYSQQQQGAAWPQHTYQQSLSDAGGRLYGNYDTQDAGGGASTGYSNVSGPVTVAGTRRVPSKGETKATPPLPASMSTLQLGNEMYRNMIYDQYFSAALSSFHPRPPSPNQRHNALPPPTHSPVSTLASIPPPRFSPQQQQAAAIIAAAAAAAAAQKQQVKSSNVIDSGNKSADTSLPLRLPLPRGSPGIVSSHSTGSNFETSRTPSPCVAQSVATEERGSSMGPSNAPVVGNCSDTDERARHRRKQEAPRRQTVIYTPGMTPSPTAPSDDSGGDYSSPPLSGSEAVASSNNQAGMTSLAPSLSHEMPMSQAMSHALNHPFLAAHLNSPTSNSPAALPRPCSRDSLPPSQNESPPVRCNSSGLKDSFDVTNNSPERRTPLQHGNYSLESRASPHLTNNARSGHLSGSQRSSSNRSPKVPELRTSNLYGYSASANGCTVQQEKLENTTEMPILNDISESNHIQHYSPVNSGNVHSNSHSSQRSVRSPHPRHESPLSNISMNYNHRVSPVPRPASESSRHSDQSQCSDPSRNSDLSRMELSRLHSPLPPSPEPPTNIRSSYNGPLPRAMATPREVPENDGSGPATDYELDLDYSVNSNQDYGSTYYYYGNNGHEGNKPRTTSNTPFGHAMTPAQKKSLSPLKTINLAALNTSDSLEEDAVLDTFNNVQAFDTRSTHDTPYATRNKSASKIRNTNACRKRKRTHSSAQEHVESLVEVDSTNQANKPSNVNFVQLEGRTDTIQQSISSQRQIAKFDNCLPSEQSRIILDKFQSLDSHGSSKVYNHSVNGILEPSSDKYQDSAVKPQEDVVTSILSGDDNPHNSDSEHHPDLSCSPRKSKKRKHEFENLGADFLGAEALLEGEDSRRRTRTRRPVSYVEDGTDPVLETAEEPSLLTQSGASPIKRRGRRCKHGSDSNNRAADGLLDVLSPSSTTTDSTSLKDALSPDRESDREGSSVTSPLSSPSGRPRGPRGRGRGRGRPPLSGVLLDSRDAVDSSLNYPNSSERSFMDNINHSGISEQVSSRPSDEEKRSDVSDGSHPNVYEFDDSEPQSVRGRRRGRGRRRSSQGGRRTPRSHGDNTGSQEQVFSPSNSVNALDVTADSQIKPVDTANDQDISSKAANDAPNHCGVSDKDAVIEKSQSVNANSDKEVLEKPKPLLTVKDPSVLLEKYSCNDDDDGSSDGNLVQPFRPISDLSQCLINAQFDSKDDDSSGDGFSPNSKADKLLDEILLQQASLACMEPVTQGPLISASSLRDEEAPSIAYVPGICRKRAAASTRNSGKNAIEKVLMTLNESIASMDHSSNNPVSNVSSPFQAPRPPLSLSSFSDGLSLLNSTADPLSHSPASSCPSIFNPLGNLSVSISPCAAPLTTAGSSHSNTIHTSSSGASLPFNFAASNTVTITPVSRPIAPAPISSVPSISITTPPAVISKGAVKDTSAFAGQQSTISPDEPPSSFIGYEDLTSPTRRGRRGCLRGRGRKRGGRVTRNLRDLESSTEEHTVTEPERLSSLTTEDTITTHNPVSSINTSAESSTKTTVAFSSLDREENVFAMSIAETVMSRSPRSASRRSSTKSTDAPLQSAKAAQKALSSPSRTSQDSVSLNSSPVHISPGSSRGRRSRRSSHKTVEPEVVVHVEVHPVPQSSLHSTVPLDLLNKNSEQQANSFVVEPVSKSDDGKEENSLISSSYAKLPSSYQDDLDNITVVPDKSTTQQLRSLRSTSMVAKGALKSTLYDFNKSDNNSSAEAIDADNLASEFLQTKRNSKLRENAIGCGSETKGVSESQISTCDEVSAETRDNKTAVGSETACSVHHDIIPVVSSSGDCGSSAASTVDTDSETVENIARFLRSTASSATAESLSHVSGFSKDLSDGDKLSGEVTVSGDCSTNVPSGTSCDSESKQEQTSSHAVVNSSSSHLSYRESRPRRVPRPPQSEEQIKEVMILLNMSDDEESDDEDYIPKGSLSNEESDVGEENDSSSEESLDVTSNSKTSDEEVNVSGCKLVDCAVSKKTKSKKTTSSGKKKHQKSSNVKRARKSMGKTNEERDAKRIKISNESKPKHGSDDVIRIGPYIKISVDGSEEAIFNEQSGEQMQSDRSSGKNQVPLPIPRATHYFGVEGELKQRQIKVGFSSTLHNNYDAFSKDLTWFCSLCKDFSHRFTLGDLLGPLFIDSLRLVKKHYPVIQDGQVLSRPLISVSGEASSCSSSGRGKGRRSSRHDSCSDSRKDLAELPTAGSAPGASSPPGRFVPTATAARKLSRVAPATTDTGSSGGGRSGSGCGGLYRSVTSINPSDIPPGGVIVGPGSYTNLPSSSGGSEGLSPHSGTECWLHENCLVWLPGVYISNSRIYGVNESVIAAQEHTCTQCAESGANIACLRKSCGQIVHFPCAVRAGWSLDFGTFHSHCPAHTPPSVDSPASATPDEAKSASVANTHANESEIVVL